jgi:hypothetical protein
MPRRYELAATVLPFQAREPIVGSCATLFCAIERRIGQLKQFIRGVLHGWHRTGQTKADGDYARRCLSVRPCQRQDVPLDAASGFRRIMPGRVRDKTDEFIAAIAERRAMMNASTRKRVAFPEHII